jgi:hypothetical protein
VKNATNAINEIIIGTTIHNKGTTWRGMIIFELLNENYTTTIHIAQIAAHTQRRLK